MSTKVVKPKASAEQVEGRSSLYNPLLQKPVALHPVGPGSYPSGFGGYTYIGPPPDFGGSYGSFHDTAGREQVGIKASKMFSVFDGSPTQLKSELGQKERDALLSQLEAAAENYKCEGCRSELTISVAKQINKVFCPHCGSEMSDAAEKVKSCVSKLGEQVMSTVEAKAKKAKSNVDLAKEAAKAPAPGEASKDFKPVEVEPKEHSDVKPEVIKPMDELSKDMVKAQADKKEALRARRAAIRASVKAFREKVAKAKAVEAAKKTQAAAVNNVEAGLNEEKLAKLRRELRVMAAAEPAKFAETKKNPKFSEICAEVEAKLVPKAERLKVRAEYAALAAEDAAAAEDVKKHLDFVAPEILMEDKKEEANVEIGEELVVDDALAAAPAEACGDMAAEVKPEEAVPAVAEELPVIEEGDDLEALSMQTEMLSSLSSLKGEKIEMSLYGEESENPFWNVTVDGEPVGRVYMQDQQVEDVSAIRAAFCNDSYPVHFGKIAREMGLEKMLHLTKTRLFAHRLDDSQTLDRVREKAKTEARAGFDVKIETLRKDFLDAVTVAMTAADKNFYTDEDGHALKGSLWNSVVQAGVSPDAAAWVVESGFEAAPAYFKFVFAKAQEIMDMPREAREEITKHIMASGKIAIETEKPEEESLAKRLVKSTVNVIAMGGDISGEDRKQIRNELKLGRR